MRSEDAIAEVSGPLRGTSATLAGSCAVSYKYDKPEAWGDCDIFVPTPQVLVSTIQCLLDNGYTMDDRYSRVWHRWLRFGFKGWHTNSMKMHSKMGVETNIVYKLVDGHPVNTPAGVLASFDLGLLGQGLNLQNMQWMDIRTYYWPGTDPASLDWPMMPDKEEAWLGGYISRYNGLRQPYRYSHYALDYGYPLQQVKPVLVQGYRMAASYHLSSSKQEKQDLGEIFNKLGDLIENDDHAEILEAYKVIDFDDPMDQIMDALS